MGSVKCNLGRRIANRDVNAESFCGAVARMGKTMASVMRETREKGSRAGFVLGSFMVSSVGEHASAVSQSADLVS